MKKKFTAPSVTSTEVATLQMIAASNGNINTQQGYFGYCKDKACTTNNPQTWSSSAKDNRDRNANLTRRSDYFSILYEFEKEWQYIGCYMYYSNGSGSDGEYFHGTYIHEGENWDLFINKQGEYLVLECPDGRH